MQHSWIDWLRRRAYWLQQNCIEWNAAEKQKHKTENNKRNAIIQMWCNDSVAVAAVTAAAQTKRK